MTESGRVGYLKGIVSEREGYQPFIIGALDRHTVWAERHSREIVFIGSTSRVCYGFGAGREFGRRINWIDRVVEGYSESKRPHHGFELNDENAVTGTGKVVGACGVGRSERVRARHPLTRGACTCPTLSTRQRKRECEEGEYPLKHDRTSCWLGKLLKW